MADFVRQDTEPNWNLKAHRCWRSAQLGKDFGRLRLSGVSRTLNLNNFKPQTVQVSAHLAFRHTGIFDLPSTSFMSEAMNWLENSATNISRTSNTRTRRSLPKAWIAPIISSEQNGIKPSKHNLFTSFYFVPDHRSLWTWTQLLSGSNSWPYLPSQFAWTCV